MTHTSGLSLWALSCHQHGGRFCRPERAPMPSFQPISPNHQFPHVLRWIFFCWTRVLENLAAGRGSVLGPRPCAGVGAWAGVQLGCASRGSGPSGWSPLATTPRSPAACSPLPAPSPPGEGTASVCLSSGDRNPLDFGSSVSLAHHHHHWF